MHKYDYFFKIFTIGDTYAETTQLVKTYAEKDKNNPILGN